MATYTNEVLVLNATATLLTTTLSGRRSVEVQNLGPNAIFCAVSSSTTDSTAAVVNKSRKVGAGEAWALDLPPGRSLYAKAATADQVTGAATVVTEVD